MLIHDGRPAFCKMNRLIVSILLSTAVAGCAHQPDANTPRPELAQANLGSGLAMFSDNPPSGLPKGWEPFIIMRTKKLTHYELMADQDRTVLYAKAASASSGLIQHVNIDPLARPWISWQWKVASLLKTADNTTGAKEDSPVRLVLGFDGDKDSLSFTDQVMFEAARLVTGREMPYATLMYIWENKVPVGTVIANSHSGRFKKMVAASGPEGLGQWRHFTRNIVEDYEKAFGEKPGRLIGVGILTDTDNTGETVDAWYGDIRLLREP
jgi:hypothetical protein